MSHAVTLELPDSLYQQLKIRSRKSNRTVEDELLTAFATDLPVLPSIETTVTRAYDEIIEFLASGPSPLEIIQFRLSDELVQHAQSLLEKDRDYGLSTEEKKELDAHIAIGDFIGILRAKAQLKQHKTLST